MKKRKLLIPALFVGAIATLALPFSGCGKADAAIAMDDVTIYAHTADKVTPVKSTGKNNASIQDGAIKINVAKDVNDIEIDLSRFFTRERLGGKDFYLTRDDVKKGDNTLVKGYAWKQTEGADSKTRKFKRLGYENNERVKPMAKKDIVELPAGDGDVRMYILDDGRHSVYLDPTPSSVLPTGETRVTYRLRGHNGKRAELKVIVNKDE
jgi:hypothetical protein